MLTKHYTMTRTGSVKNERMCGLDGITIVDYTATICVENLILDSDGFMVNHEDVHSLVKTPLRLGMSCEVAIKNAMEDLTGHFESLLIARRMKLRSITLQVGMRGGDAHFTLTQTY